MASGPAAADNLLFSVSVIVVGQLFTPPDRARRPDPDDPVRDVYVAVRPAGVINETCNVAADRRIDDGPIRQLKAPDVPAFPVPTLAFQALLVGDLLAGVIDDAGVLRNRARGVNAPPMDPRSPLLDH